MKCGNVIRDGYWDLVKGLCVMFVFSIHFIGDNSGDFFVYLIRQFSSMAVFVFVALAGYFTSTSNIVRSAPIKYVIKRIVRLGVPYLFWTISFVAFSGNFELSSCYEFFHSLLWRDLFLGYGIIVGYYVIVMLQLTILSPFLIRCAMHEPKKILVFSFVLGVLTSFVATAASSKWITVGIQAPVPFPGILFTMWIFPYSIGLVVKSHNLISVLSRWRWYLLSITVFLFFFLIGEDYLGRASGIKTQAQFNLSGLLCATVFMLLIFAYHNKLPRIKILEVIGRGSYFVYLTHFRLLLYVASLWGFEMMGGKVMIVKYLFGMICFIAFYSSLIIIAEHGLNKKIRCLVGL